MLMPTNLKKGSKEREKYEKDNAHLIAAPNPDATVNRPTGLRVPKDARSKTQEAKEKQEEKAHLASKVKAK